LSPTEQVAKGEKQESALPLARYSSLVGTQTVLLLFTAFFLPRSTMTLLGPAYLPLQKSSVDRPQHPFLEPLTASPSLTLAWMCSGVAAIMPWWAGYMRVWVNSMSNEVSEESGNVAARLYKGRGEAVRRALLITVLAIPPIYALLVFFGAPLNSHYIPTLLLSTLLSLLIVFTPAYALGVPSWSSESSGATMQRLNYVRLFSEMATRTHIDRALVFPAVSTLVGCWLGAFPLPLDWDRPWQSWPLVPAYMAIMGYIVGSVASLLTSITITLASFDRQKVKVD